MYSVNESDEVLLPVWCSNCYGFCLCDMYGDMVLAEGLPTGCRYSNRKARASGIKETVAFCLANDRLRIV